VKFERVIDLKAAKALDFTVPTTKSALLLSSRGYRILLAAGGLGINTDGRPTYTAEKLLEVYLLCL
jgi:hypothetical protein